MQFQSLTEGVSTHASVRRRQVKARDVVPHTGVSTHASVRRRRHEVTKQLLLPLVSTHASVRRRRPHCGLELDRDLFQLTPP